MKSALPRLITTAASWALYLGRLGGSRSDRSCHQLVHTSHCAEGLLGLSVRLKSCSKTYQQPVCGSEYACLFSLARGKLIVLVARHQRPDNPSIFVRHRRPVCATALDQLPHPLASSVCFTSHPADRCPCPMHQELAERAVAAFADAEQAFLTPGGMLARHQPEPGSKLTAVFERAGIADGSHQGRRA